MSNKLFMAALVAIILMATLVSSLPEPDRQVFPISGAIGPESLAFDRHGGGPYTGVSDGRIIKWQSNESRWINFAITTPHRRGCEGKQDHIHTESRCGRPLGLSFNQKSGDLYIADAYKGLLVVGPTGGLAKPLAKQAEGFPFKFTNGVVVDQSSGIVYFTDSSTRFRRRDYVFVIFSGDNTGRLLKYDPATKKVTVLLRHLKFPNGVALSRNNDFLLLTETTNCRVLKFWLEPSSKAGKVEVFANLSGIPDNINSNKRGEFWVAINSRLGGPTNLPEKADPSDDYFGFGLAVRLGESGDVLEKLEDKNGDTWKYGSDIVEKNGHLWIGSVVESYAYKLKISN